MGETTGGGAKRLGGNDQGGNVGGETTRGGNGLGAKRLGFDTGNTTDYHALQMANQTQPIFGTVQTLSFISQCKQLCPCMATSKHFA